MERLTHGGDRYQKNIRMDFSVNINPLGVPEKVKHIWESILGELEYYPDMEGRSLKEQLAKKLGVPKEFLLLGNGASELFMIVIHSLKPKKIVVPVPSFVGYEHVVRASEGETVFFKMDENLSINKDLLTVLDERVDLLFLTNPNNPTGKYIDQMLLQEILEQCKREGILVLLDECFMELSDDGNGHTWMRKLVDYPNVLLVQAFTKTYGIPGVRLGYLVCSNPEIRDTLQKHTPEWNLSVIAQKVGRVALEEADYLERSVELMKRERNYLENALEDMGFKVIPSNTNFLMFRWDDCGIDWYEELLKEGILIRDCGNFRGLEKGFYRIAVKEHGENEELVETMKKIVAKRMRNHGNRNCTPGRD